MLSSVFLNDTFEVPHYHCDWCECVSEQVCTQDRDTYASLFLLMKAEKAAATHSV